MTGLSVCQAAELQRISDKRGRRALIERLTAILSGKTDCIGEVEFVV